MKNRTKQNNLEERGYALLDVALALTIFAFSITSLVVLLQKITDTSTNYARDRLIQSAIASYLTETKRKPVQEMTGEFLDENLGITFRAEVEPFDLANAEGNALKDLYKLTVTAAFEDDGDPQEETAELFIYQPEKK